MPAVILTAIYRYVNSLEDRMEKMEMLLKRVGFDFEKVIRQSLFHLESIRSHDIIELHCIVSCGVP